MQGSQIAIVGLTDGTDMGGLALWRFACVGPESWLLPPPDTYSSEEEPEVIVEEGEASDAGDEPAPLEVQVDDEPPPAAPARTARTRT